MHASSPANLCVNNNIPTCCLAGNPSRIALLVCLPGYHVISILVPFNWQLISSTIIYLNFILMHTSMFYYYSKYFIRVFVESWHNHHFSDSWKSVLLIMYILDLFPNIQYDTWNSHIFINLSYSNPFLVGVLSFFWKKNSIKSLRIYDFASKNNLFFS